MNLTAIALTASLSLAALGAHEPTPREEVQQAQNYALIQGYVDSTNASVPIVVDEVTTLLRMDFSRFEAIVTMLYRVDTSKTKEIDWAGLAAEMFTMYCGDGPAGWLRGMGVGNSLSYIDENNESLRELVILPDDCPEEDLEHYLQPMLR